ncbi:hypothetical protein NPIL_359831 [Nephila pilipes]|uniref:Uncharacterized protein n=1 Tax=Nephila pilipes TaxID=299642 RepID=A0A8X6U7J1_NEPPI|nr:hypothetical protein NPIL_359831 [Nephila pilipes]
MVLSDPKIFGQNEMGDSPLNHFCYGNQKFNPEEIKSIMLYTWLPSMTLCMSMLSNGTMGPETKRIERSVSPAKSRIPYSRYLNAAMILIQAALPKGEAPFILLSKGCPLLIKRAREQSKLQSTKLYNLH